ncbi:hypothetical protein KC909_05840 [Candidatus Dojkabacteria bacterium]|uniref:Uncharacterized protein n=1 Tax=Candidatus Dojkabacteria bacterium TaxID=2099670 RepID=A0A955L6E3_9BACT|nr:hypothetical protein [Candidatus Dojkabacteria bacterium]
MSVNRTLIIILLLVVPLLELILETSSISFLLNLKIIYIVTLAIMLTENTRWAIVYLFLSTIFVELILVEPVGLGAFVFLLAWIITNLIFQFVTLLSEDSFAHRAIVVLISGILIRHGIFLLLDQQSTLLEFSSLLVNLLFLVIIIWLTSKVISSRNVYSKFRTI